VPDVSFTLLTGVAQGKMVFIGKGGAIDGVVNPTLAVRAEAVVQVTLINGEGAEHDVALPDFKAKSDKVVNPGASSTIVFRVGKEGTFEYFCTIAGHREAGMLGKLVVQAAVAEAAPAVKSIAQSPSEIPKPIGNRGPTTLRCTSESTPSSRARAWVPWLRLPRTQSFCGGRTSISTAPCRMPRRPGRFWTIPRPTNARRWSIGCSRVRSLPGTCSGCGT